jgi:hypothetical protein
MEFTKRADGAPPPQTAQPKQDPAKS